MSAPPPTNLEDPSREYRRRHDLYAGEERRWQQLSGRLSFVRLALLLAGIVVAWLAVQSRVLHPLWILPFVVGFFFLVLYHDRVVSRRERARRRAALYDAGLARLEGRWAGRGVSGEAWQERGHPYAPDLDLFGRASLFERLCTARTRAGQRTLARWLQHPASPAEVRERQEAVAQLRGRLDLREDLALLGEDVEAGLHPEALESWVRRPPWKPGWARYATVAASLASVFTLTTWLAFSWPAWPFALALLFHGLLLLSQRGGFEPVVEAVEQPGRDLGLLAGLLARIEAEEATAPRLRRLREQLDTAGQPPSRQIARLERLIVLLDARRNLFFSPIEMLTFWSFHLAGAVERWRQRCGPALGGWIEAAGEFEALTALAAYAYENPEDPFATLDETGERQPYLEAEGLAHPLLPASQAVRNDVALRLGGTEGPGGAPQAFIVSGSNMSGKSTLLRALGANTVLAQAGAPVRARRLALTPLAVGASIRVQDSLEEGKSRFYAEITRLQQIVALCGAGVPVLFLIDELLAGTNSHDRRIGAEALVRGLVDKGALGLLTTHDLALARVVDSLAPKVRNVHFEDTLEDGELSFDYRLREGVVKKSNALELMRSVGLEV